MTYRVLHFIATVLIIGSVATGIHAQDASSEEASIEERREQARVERLWNLNWRAIAPYFLERNGDYVCVPGFERSAPSSTGQSVSDYRKASAWEQSFTDERGRNQTRKLTKPEDDAFAAVALIPDIAVGQYGYIHSGQIEAIIDEKTLELEDVWLVDAEAVREEKQQLKEKLWGQVLEDIEDAIRDRRKSKRSRRDRRMAENDAIDWGFKAREEAAARQRDAEYSRYTWVVEGFATGTLREDARWPSRSAKGDGLQLVVVEVKDRTVTAVPAASLGRGISELQFIDYLQSKDIDKAAFVAMVTDAKREHRSDYVQHVLAQLTGASVPAIGRETVNNEVELAD
jgi:hypothetical protein